jgi:flagellar biosynthesis anti-sigma factor FlgM
MKGISSQAAVNAYQRAGIKPIGNAQHAPSIKEQQPTPRENPGAAKVSISKEARALATENSAQLQAQKVDALRAQVESGNYQIDSSRIAERMLGLA